MQNQNSSPFDWGNSLIGNIALIKDMIPQMQVNSTNAGPFHTYRVAASVEQPIIYIGIAGGDGEGGLQALKYITKSR